MMKIINYLFLLMLIILAPSIAFAADHYVREGASGANNGADWADAYTTLPATLTRGDTYYVADGSYSSYGFDDATSGSTLITIKKAIESDHGTSIGWSSTYGNGQAVFWNVIAFKTSYYVFDGNGTHTIPSDNTNDYGFKISSNSSTNILGIVRIGTAGNTPSNITIKYVHVYNTTNGSINNGTVSVRWYPGQTETYIKLQNCFFENSGKDGLQISQSSYILVEKSYIKRLGRLYAGSPDYHGQTVQIFYGGDNIIFRWNIFEANEGQGLIQIAGVNNPTENVRFYGNVVFVDYGKSPSTPGFNISGGIFGNAWRKNSVNNIYVYNNTIVNIGGDGEGVARFPNIGPGSNWYSYNNLFYNNVSTSYSGWDGYGYHASGGSSTAGGTNEQVGLKASIFTNYTSNDFRLASATDAALTLSFQGWWDTTDSFFGYLDSDLDMYGNIRGSDDNWDRGAFEFSGTIDTTAPSEPTGLSVQ